MIFCTCLLEHFRYSFHSLFSLTKVADCFTALIVFFPSRTRFNSCTHFLCDISLEFVFYIGSFLSLILAISWILFGMMGVWRTKKIIGINLVSTYTHTLPLSHYYCL